MIKPKDVQLSLGITENATIAMWQVKRILSNMSAEFDKFPDLNSERFRVDEILDKVTSLHQDLIAIDKD